MKSIIGWIIAFIILLFIFLFPQVYWNHKNQVIIDNKIKELRDSINDIQNKYDSVINIQMNQLDGLKVDKENVLIIYEKAEKDFSDSNIISDDSIIMYIAKKIQD